ncbi:MAG: efflux RND transporter periplasmic adaptor subunit [Acidobacteriota bacterium]|nr:efflux RND transporter periplasmic adaptor subunit [Acidobacteriota bacterium]
MSWLTDGGWKSYFLVAAGVLVLVLLSTSCAGDGNASTGESSPETTAGADSDGGEKDKEEAVPVEVAALGRGPIEAVLRSSTSLEAESHVEVFSEANRRVVELFVEEGDPVRAGDVLLRLQDDAQRSELAKVESQLARAERDYEQQKRLYEQQMISEKVYNDASYELDQLRLALADAERELGYAEIRAPIGGVITARRVNLGDQVNVGQHVFDIVDFDSIVARLHVPEKHLADLREGLAARITAPSLAGRAYRGTVGRISPIVDPKSGTVKVTVDVGRQAGLRPGMYVDVDLVTAVHDQAVLVPKRALVYDQERVFVFRLGDERRVERVAVVPVLSDKNHVEPLDGLSAGDRLVVAGQAGLKDGSLVSLPGDPEVADSDKDDQDDDKA